MYRSKIIILACLLSMPLMGCGGLLDDLKEESREVERDARAEERREQLYGLRRAPAGTSANNIRDFAGRPTEYGRALRDRGDDAYSKYNEYANEFAEENLPNRRYTRRDFVDRDESENSLWNSTGQNNYYFSQNQRFDPGDLVVVTVERGLRREIQYRLWRSLPTEMRRIPKKKPSRKEEGQEGDEDKRSEPERAIASARERVEQTKDELDKLSGGSLSKDKGDDMLRMEVIENMGNGLVRMIGQKRVIYRGRPKFVEVSALMRSRNIDKNSRAKSSLFLDQRARVVK